jgi:hypothetical protein
LRICRCLRKTLTRLVAGYSSTGRPKGRIVWTQDLAVELQAVLEGLLQEFEVHLAVWVLNLLAVVVRNFVTSLDLRGMAIYCPPLCRFHPPFLVSVFHLQICQPAVVVHYYLPLPLLILLPLLHRRLLHRCYFALGFGVVEELSRTEQLAF